MTRRRVRDRLRRCAGALTQCLLLAMLVASVACGDSGRAQHFSLATGFTSAREEEAAKHNVAYALRLRRAAQLAEGVKTDSLRKLYLTALDAQHGTSDTVWKAIGCEHLRMMEQVGSPVMKRVDQHLRDSLATSPDFATRWLGMQVPDTGSLAGCWPSQTPLPDSLETLPYPNRLPF
jgi:hypothetical protein